MDMSAGQFFFFTFIVAGLSFVSGVFVGAVILYMIAAYRSYASFKEKEERSMNMLNNIEEAIGRAIEESEQGDLAAFFEGNAYDD
jgi:hypothetical protein